MKKYIALLLLACSQAFAGLSTINPAIPATNAPLQSAPMRANFAAAYTDVNGLIQQNNSHTAPSSPVLGQLWLDTNSTTYILKEWDGASWVTRGTINSVTHAWSNSGTFNGNTWPAGTGTLSIAAGKTLTSSNTLTFTGTDASSAAFGTGGTVAYTANNLSAFAATTSAQLASVISNETGTGLVVFNNAPTFINPTLGTALATSINGTLITAGTGTLTITGGKTLTSNVSLTVSGSDVTMTTPTTSFTAARTDAGNTFIGSNITSKTSGSTDLGATNYAWYYNVATPSTTSNLLRFAGAISSDIYFGRVVNADTFGWGVVGGAATMTFAPSTGALTISGNETHLTTAQIAMGTGTTTTAGLRLVPGTGGGGASGYGWIYPENVTPSSTNYAIGVRYTGQQTLLNSATGGSVIQSVNDTTVTSTTAAGMAVTGSLSSSTTMAVGGTTLNVSPAAGFQYNGSSGKFMVRTNGQEAYFVGTAVGYIGSNDASSVLNIVAGGNPVVGFGANHLITAGIAVPTVATNDCGSSTQGTITAGGNDNAFLLTAGTAAVTSCAVTFGTAWAAAPRACTITPANTTAAAAATVAAYVSAITTTKVTISGAALASASYYVHCF